MDIKRELIDSVIQHGNKKFKVEETEKFKKIAVAYGLDVFVKAKPAKKKTKKDSVDVEDNAGNK